MSEATAAAHEDATPGGDAAAVVQKIQELLAQATAFHKATLLTEAAGFYEQILALAPNHPMTLHLLGVLRHAQGRFDEAATLLGAAVAVLPGKAGFHAALGAALRGAGRLEEALAAYDTAIALHPDFAEAHNHRGVALQKLDRIEAAIAAYRAALAVRPDYADAYNNLGTALRRAGRPAEALDAYRTALVHHPSYVDALGNLAKLEAEQGLRQEAVETYQRLLALRGDDIDALQAMGDLLVLLDRDEEALGFYTAALELRPRDPNLFDRLSIPLLMLDRHGEAAALLQTALDIDPRHAAAQLHYGIALEKLGHVDEAATALRTAIALDPSLPLGHFTLGVLCLAIGLADEAKAVFADWYERAPEHPTARHMVAAVCGTAVPERASTSYIVETFDAFAKTFDRQLAQLDYRAPQLLDGLLQTLGVEAAGSLVIGDLGCGTGLCAPFLRPRARRLVGVDLAPEMLARARRRALYDDLIERDLVDFLGANPAVFDLLIAADTLIYFGDLTAPLAAAAAALVPDGRILFTLEEIEDADDALYVLASSGRFQHTEAGVRDYLAATGLRLVHLERAVVRTEAGRPVPSLLIAAAVEPPI